MKKTMIAMGVAAAVIAPIASADVAVSGRVEQTFVDDDATGTGWTQNTFNTLVFSASEDLGNGMTASAKFALLDKDGNNGTTNGNNQTVALSGGFGTIVAGTMEDFTESKAMAMMTMYGPAGIELGNSNANRTPGGVAYVSPAFSGFTVGVAGFAGASGTGTENFDATDVMVSYSNGPLSGIVTLETQDKDSDLTTASADDQEQLSFGMKYKISDDLSVAGLWVSNDNQEGTADNDNDDFMARLDYTMGNNKITLAMAEDENSAGTSTTDYTSMEVIHNLSSRTAAYIGFMDKDTADTDKTYVGIQHSF